MPYNEDSEDAWKHKKSRDIPFLDWSFIAYFVAFSIGVMLLFLSLLGASVAAMEGQLHFLRASFYSVLVVQDLTPNVGIWWYHVSILNGASKYHPCVAKMISRVNVPRAYT